MSDFTKRTGLDKTFRELLEKRMKQIREQSSNDKYNIVDTTYETTNNKRERGVRKEWQPIQNEQTPNP